MSKGQTTSASIPRFDSGYRPLSYLFPGVSDYEQGALIYFTIGLKLGGVETKEISEWAHAYSYSNSARSTSDWVWDILEPDTDIPKVIQRKMPFEEVAHNARYMMMVMLNLIENKKIRVRTAMPYISDLKWQGGIWVSPALSKLLDIWNRCEVLTGNNGELPEQLEKELEEQYLLFLKTKPISQMY